MISLQPASGEKPGWQERFIYGPVGRFVSFSLGWIPRSFKSALSLSGEERQTLMSWGLLLGVVALTAAKIWSEWQMYGHWKDGVSETLQSQLIDNLFWQLTWDTLLQAALAMGVVAIARGGSMLVSIEKGALKMDFQGSGAAAKAIATDAGNLVPLPSLPAPEPAPGTPAAIPAPVPAPTATYKGPEVPPPAPGTPENAPWSR